jgi:Protein of unknown function (DUF3987)
VKSHSEQPLPHDVSAEHGLVGLLCEDWQPEAGHIQPEQCYLPMSGAVVQCAHALNARGVPVNLETLDNELRERALIGDGKPVGSIADVSECANHLAMNETGATLVARIQDTWERRRAIGTANELVMAAYSDHAATWKSTVSRIVRELTSVARGSDEDTSNSLNSSRYSEEWPEPMADAAFIGPVGAWVKKLDGQTEAARESLLVQALVAAGNAMGRHGHYKVEANLHHTNLFVAVAGGTAARKGVAWGQVRSFVRHADALWEIPHVINGLSSGEGLINAVRDAIDEDDEPPIPDKVALAIETEFAAVFKVKGREGNTLGTVLRQAWDGDTLRTLTKHSPLQATDAHISVVGHVTFDELRRVMSETDAGNGFANRILWVCVKRACYLPDGGDDVNINDEVRRLHEAIAYGQKAGRLKRDAEASALWRRRYHDLSSGRPGLLGAVTNRAEAQVTRLSLIYALLDRSDDVKRVHLEAALAVWDYCLASARFIFGAALGDALAEALDKELAKHGAEGMARTEISNHFGNNRSKEEIARALGVLASQSRAEKRREKGDGGREVDRWYTVMHNENNEFNVNSHHADGDDGLPAPLFPLNSLNSYPVADTDANNGHKEHKALTRADVELRPGEDMFTHARRTGALGIPAAEANRLWNAPAMIPSFVEKWNRDHKEGR